MPDNEARVIQFLQQLAQEWEHLLYSTDGALNLHKCSLFLISWILNNGKAKQTSEEESPGILSQTSGSDLSIV
jgi:hypothetical protein